MGGGGLDGAEIGGVADDIVEGLLWAVGIAGDKTTGTCGGTGIFGWARLLCVVLPLFGGKDGTGGASEPALLSLLGGGGAVGIGGGVGATGALTAVYNNYNI